MNRQILGAIALVGLLWVPDVTAQDAQVERGVKIFADQKCTLCHMVAGKGNKNGPLDGVGSKLTAAEMKAWITTPAEMAKKVKAERKPPMKQFKLAPDEVDALVAYLQTLKKS